MAMTVQGVKTRLKKKLTPYLKKEGYQEGTSSII